MNQLGTTNYHHFNSTFSNGLSNCTYLSPSDMDGFWRHNVPNSMPEAFNIAQDKLNQSSDELFRFTANSPTVTASPINLNNSLPINLIQPPASLSHSSNWKTISNLSEASNSIGPYKRKCLLDEQDDLSGYQPPNKQNATEEKVIGRFNRLTIDEEFEDSDEFFLALDDAPIEEPNEHGEEPLEVETDDVLKCEKVQFELADQVQEFWNCDDVISKLVREQKEKNSKALVLWQPRVTLAPDSSSDDDKDEEEGEPKKSSEVVLLDRTSEYTVTEEASNDAFESEPRASDDLKLEISEWDEDEDMMEI